MSKVKRSVLNITEKQVATTFYSDGAIVKKPANVPSVTEVPMEEQPLNKDEIRARIAELYPRITPLLAELKEKTNSINAESFVTSSEKFAGSAKSAEIAQEHEFKVSQVLIALDSAVRAVERLADEFQK